MEEHRLHLPGDFIVVDVDVDFVVDAEAAIVEVRGADGRPVAVHHHGLGVHHGGLIFEDADAAAEEQLVVHAAGLPDQRNVGEFAGDNDPHVDSAPHRAFQRANRVAVGDEVGVADVDRVRGADDGDDVQQLHGGASLSRG